MNIPSKAVYLIINGFIVFYSLNVWSATASVNPPKPTKNLVQTKLVIPPPKFKQYPALATTNAKAVRPTKVTNSKPVKNTYAEPFTYCAVINNADKPAKPYAGPKMPWSIAKALTSNKQVLDMILNTDGYATWRCMNKQVYACVVGANIPCEAKADTSKKPHNGIVQYCKQEKNTDFIPAAATGRTTIYDWSCKAGKPVRGKQVMAVDARGYPKSFWERIVRK